MDKDTSNTVLVVGALGVGLFAVSKMFGGVGTFFRGGVKSEDVKYIKDKYQNHKDLIKALNIKQNKLSFNRDTYKKVADIQRKAMVGPGTDEEALFTSLGGMNGDDLKTVFMDFGLQAVQGDPFGFTRRDIIDWYYKELGTSDLDKMREIWKQSGLMR